MNKLILFILGLILTIGFIVGYNGFKIVNKAKVTQDSQYDMLNKIIGGN